MPRTWQRLAAMAVGVAVVLTAPVQVASQTPQKTAAKPATKAEMPPIIQSVFPPGATIGAVSEWTFTGTRLDKIDRWLISGTGVEITEMKTKASTLTAKVRVAEGAEPGYRELRGVGPEGVSNLLLFRVDNLPQTVESEPNDEPGKANAVMRGSAVSGVLKAQDVDYFRVEGQAGRRIVLDVEAQRLGTPIAPVVTIFSAGGVSLAQAREHPGNGHDSRMAIVFPSTGSYLIEVRDNTYNGSDTAAYRLRLDEAPFATGMFPLGGPRGQTITVTASGGDLETPRSKTVTLPDTPGETVDVGLFDGPEGAALAPAKLVVGDGPEVSESAAGPDGQSTTELPVGSTANGRIDKPGEVDRYTVKVKKNEALHIRIQAAPLGSWLDSVVAVKDDKGKQLAENDDPVQGNRPQRGGIAFGLPESPPDSRLDFTPQADGELTIEVADRYGDGGPEYAYRLDVRGAKPDFAINLVLVNPNANRQGAVPAKGAAVSTPGSAGAFNLRAGARVPVNFIVNPEGFSGTIEVSAEGLPKGVTATSTKVTIPPNNKTNQPAGGLIELRADSEAESALGELRIVARAKTAGLPPDLPIVLNPGASPLAWPMILLDAGPAKTRLIRSRLPMSQEITRAATAQFAFSALPTANQGPFGAPRPITRILGSLPVAVIGGPRRDPSKKAGPGNPSVLALKKIAKPGALLQGGQIELAIELDPPHPVPDSFRLEAEVNGKGLLTQTVISDNEEGLEQESDAAALIWIRAAVNADLGSKMLRITFVPKHGETVIREIPIEVRTPIVVSVPKEPIQIQPGGTATFRVDIKREPGFNRSVDLKVESLPDGIKTADDLRITRGQNGLDVQLEMDAQAVPLAQPVAFRVVGVAAMPRGPVRVDSANRAMVMSHSAEK